MAKVKKDVLRLLSNRVAVKEAKVAEMTPGGIVLPEDAKEKPTKGVVMAAGPGFTDSSTGHVTPMSVAVGDVVIYGKYSGKPIEVNGESLRVLDESEILAVVET